ncbi:FAD-dependent oxidoreductase [Alteromonadaceae bacterium M269]|nr:FAD-dependent oxidoreductase [Alteromonadaceae bacterium M269]
MSSKQKAIVIGSGVVGLTVADYLTDSLFDVTIYSASSGPDSSCCSWWAGGMLAPYCEQETAEPIIGKLAKESLVYWQDNAANYHSLGTLVLATQRDLPLLYDFKNKTESWLDVGRTDIERLEPHVDRRLISGLYFENEAHIDPRKTLQKLEQKLKAKGAIFNYGQRLSDEYIETQLNADWIIDCRGMGGKKRLSSLRGVRGEMLYLQSDEIQLSRPIRLLHPRIPIYIVPRGNGLFMVGASMIESENDGPISVRATMELLSSVYTVNPAFGEASILETGADLRPAFDDNIPAIHQDGRYLSINGMYRHGYLAAPAMARRTLDIVSGSASLEEIRNEDYS